ncbi:hypothetical protein [Aliarcobacter cryaerophilus]|uniref:hypothetical protein n=1 Tax=Aliarcobacter cryaerophilus TaxID=28198 RepID=UPI0021B56A34|nr:hypothetical protein [Aliarcobacter cryaerophilus]MCT7520532.1 hypothetical protein [Aliarcobacter cryaerophilus]
MFSIFTIYISLLPISAETQPILPLALSILILFNNFYFRNQISKDIIIAISLILVLTVYYIFGKFGFGDGSLITYLKYIVGPLIYISIRNNILHLNYKFVSFIVFIFFILFILLHFNLFQNIQGLIIERSLHSFDIGRFSLLTNEPSYFAYFLIIILVYVDLSYYNRIISLKQYNLLRFTIIFIAFNIKSGLVYLIIIIYFLSIFLFYRLKKKIYFLTITFIILISLLTFDLGRPTVILDNIWLLINGKTDINSLIFKYETSGSTRVILNYLAFFNIFDNPFGSGLGSFLGTLQNTNDVFGSDIINHEVLKNKTTDEAQTYLANLFNDIGIFAFLMIYLIFINNKSSFNSSEKRIKCFIAMCLIILLIFQCQITNPIPWILIAILKEKNLYINR